MNFNSDMAESVYRSKYMIEGVDKELTDPLKRIDAVVAKYYPELEGKAIEYGSKKWVGFAGGLYRSAMNPDRNVSAINCTTLFPIEDNLESISEGLYWWAKFAAYGQGEGLDFSNLRPKGAKVHNSSKESTGAVSFMHTYDSVLQTIAQQGRRGASLISINITHPDVLDFINVKDEEGVLESANISIQVTDEFMNAVENDEDWTFIFKNEYDTITSKMPAKKLFRMIAEHAHISGDPGLQFIDIAKKYSNSDYLGYPIVSTNACSFTPDTLVTTKFGIFPIKDLVGKDVEIFDGKKWVDNNEFRVTGYDQDIYRVTLENGLYFDVTDQHRFFTEDGTEKRTNELTIGDKLEYNLEAQVYSGNHVEKGAYAKGFLLGDGNVVNSENSMPPRPTLWLYSPKFMCFPKLKSSFEEIPVDFRHRNSIEEVKKHFYESSGEDRCIIDGISGRERNELYKWASDYKDKLPNDVYNWSEESKLQLIAGLFDADGTCLNNKNGFGYQVSSTKKEFLVDVLRLLSTVGIYGRLSIMRDDGYKVIKGQKVFCSATWRLTIPQRYAIELSKKVSFERLDSFSGREVKRNVNFRYNQVASIEKLEEKAKKVYCTSVDSTSRFLVNGGIITGNSEQWLDGHNVCLLSSVNLAKYHEYGWDGYLKLIDYMVHVLDAFRQEEINENRTPSEIQKRKLEDMPRIGLGFTGLADYFIRKGIQYGSKESIQEIGKISGTLSGEAYKASYNIAKNRGYSFPEYDKESYKKSPFVQRLIDGGFLSEEHLEYQAHVCKTTIAPNGSLTMTVEAGGSGIEPIFGKYYVRRERSTTGDWKEWFSFNDLVVQELEARGLEVTKENADTLDPKLWVTAHTLDNDEKVKLIAEAQKYIDSAISVTYNLPKDATVDDVEKIYMDAWKNDLKGVTVYREGSKVGVLITDANYEETKDKKIEDVIITEDGFEKRPKSLPCDIHEVKYKGDKYLLLVGLRDNEPYEIFVTKNADNEFDMEKHKKGRIDKNGKGKYSLVVLNGVEKTYVKDIIREFDPVYATLGRFVSMSLRHGVPLQFIVEQLAKEKDNFLGFERTVGRVLKKYIKEGEVVKSSKSCPNCGSAELAYVEGCVTCMSCGNSKCD